MQAFIDTVQKIRSLIRHYGSYQAAERQEEHQNFTEAEIMLMRHVEASAEEIYKTHDQFYQNQEDLPELPLVLLLTEYRHPMLIEHLLSTWIVHAHPSAARFAETEFQEKVFFKLFESYEVVSGLFVSNELSGDVPSTETLPASVFMNSCDILDRLAKTFHRLPMLYTAALYGIFKSGSREDVLYFIERYANQLDLVRIVWQGRVQSFLHFVIRECSFAVDILSFAAEQVTQRLNVFDQREQSSPFLRRDSEWNDPLSVAALLDRPAIFKALVELMDQSNITAESLLNAQGAQHPFEAMFNARAVNTLHQACQMMFESLGGMIAELGITYLQTSTRALSPYVVYRFKGVSGAAVFSEILLKQFSTTRRLAYLSVGPKNHHCRLLLDDFERAILSLEHQFSGAMAMLSPDEFEAFRVKLVAHFLKARDLKLFADALSENPRKRDQMIVNTLQGPYQGPSQDALCFDELDLFFGSHEAFLRQVSLHLESGDDELMTVGTGSIERYMLHLLEAPLEKNLRLNALEAVISFIVTSQEAEPYMLSVAIQLIDRVSDARREALLAPLVSRILSLIGSERVSRKPEDQLIAYVKKVAQMTLVFYMRAPGQFDTPERFRNAWCSAWDFEGESMRPDQVLHPHHASFSTQFEE